MQFRKQQKQRLEAQWTVISLNSTSEVLIFLQFQNKSAELSITHTFSYRTRAGKDYSKILWNWLILTHHD